MKCSLIIFSLLALAAWCMDEQAWSEWKHSHNKKYQNLTHDKLKFTIWKAHALSINQHNARYMQGLETYQQKLNKFHDLTRAEFLRVHTGAKLNLNARKTAAHNTNRSVLAASTLKAAVDWRNVSGYVQPVKDQGNCG